jgi:hypothetical protein
MRRFLFLILVAATVMTSPVEAASRIIKVLPQFQDLKGRHALSPSLYERDAYQAHLRDHPKERSGIRFNVQWKSDREKSPNLKVRLEIRGTKGNTISTKTLEESAKKDGWLTSWTEIKLEGDAYKAFGELIAWHATLWEGEEKIAEQSSFLW